MTEVEFDTEYGPVGVAVRTGDEYGDEAVSRIENAISAGLSLQESLVVVRPLAEALLAETDAIPQPTDSGRELAEITAEFGLELGGRGRFIVAEAQASASLKVRLTWKGG